jgi:hypothetical protein
MPLRDRSHAAPDRNELHARGAFFSAPVVGLDREFDRDFFSGLAQLEETTTARSATSYRLSLMAVAYGLPVHWSAY